MIIASVAKIIPADRTTHQRVDVGRVQQLAATKGRATSKVEFNDARRVQESLCAPVERRVLRWLASRMPDWVTPDHLTILGLTAQLGGGVCFAISRWFPPALLI